MVGEVVGRPLLVHSTSWCRARDAVVLAFIVVIDEAEVTDMESLPNDRAELARSEATAAPKVIDHRQVLEHALRHLAWLAQDDRLVADVLDDEWKAALSRYGAEPSRALG